MTDSGPVNGTIPAVHAEGVSKYFKDKAVLSDISLMIQPGEVVAIIGPSGAGKSSFLRCINHLETIEAGRLSVYGKLIGYEDKGTYLRGVSSRQLALARSRIGMVFQHFNLFANMNALQNVALCPRIVRKESRQTADERARALLAKVGLSHRIDAYPHSLSGGERQRVAIARALAMDPNLLLFDEPTSALDPELVAEVLHVIEDLSREGRTMVLVTHEISFARRVADKVAVMANGELIEMGPVSQVLDDPQHPRTKEFLLHVQ